MIQSRAIFLPEKTLRLIQSELCIDELLNHVIGAS
jgi:hypothetical protein